MDASGRNASRRDRKIPARVWNDVVRAADAARRESHDQSSDVTAHAKAANIILVRNTAGGTVPRYGVIAFDGVENNPAASPSAESSFCNAPVLTGVKPLGGDTAWGIALDPIRNGQIGRVAVSGAIPAKIAVSDSSHRFAVPKKNNVTALESAAAGSASILWSEGQGVIRWCLIRIGGDGGRMRIGKTSPGSAWTKGTLADISIYEDGTPPNETSSNETISDVVNHWADVPANKWVGIQQAANGHYYLVVAEC